MADMIVGEIPSFEKVIESIRELEARARADR